MVLRKKINATSPLVIIILDDLSVAHQILRRKTSGRLKNFGGRAKGDFFGVPDISYLSLRGFNFFSKQAEEQSIMASSFHKKLKRLPIIKPVVLHIFLARSCYKEFQFFTYLMVGECQSQ